MIYSSMTHHGVNPVCRGVFGVFDGKFNNALPLEQTWAGAHGKTSNLLHTRNEEIHPAQTTTTTTNNQWIISSVNWFITYVNVLNFITIEMTACDIMFTIMWRLKPTQGIKKNLLFPEIENIFLTFTPTWLDEVWRKIRCFEGGKL